MRRREFLGLTGCAAISWPFVARAQQNTLPVIGYLGTATTESDAPRVAAFRRGLNETGYVEGKNVTLEFRWADGQYNRLPQQVAELIELRVAAIFAGTLPAILAVKATQTSIPAVFANGNDPVKFGLVTSINKPSGNITGVSFLINVLAAKQLEMLHETVPRAASIGFFVNPNNPNAGIDTREVQAAAAALGRRLLIMKTSNRGEIDAAFVVAVEQQAGALIFHADSYLTSQHELLAMQVARSKIPAIFHLREFASAGGLMSYGASITDAYRQAGIYAGRILRGEKPGDLPVQQSTKIELVINLKAAKALGLTVAPTLLARADEVIE